MPLPPALAARLAKRGLVEKAKEKKEEEEVFVEHYDEEEKVSDVPPMQEPEPEVTKVLSQVTEEQPNILEKLIHEKSACPNQSNPYHVCVDWCTNKWGYSRFEPDKDMERKRDRMLTRYPLPPGWMEVGDPITHRYYYWNSITDEVSWMPPLHPRARITVSAEKLKESSQPMDTTGASGGESDDDSRKSRSDSDSDSGDSDVDSDHSDMDAEDDFETLERQILQEKKKKEERNRSRQQRRQKEDALDPMDPAAYSDIPRGKWSDGLVQEGDAKTGVDATVSGPLFQQRPYPSPGDILRMNAGKK